MKPFIYYIFTLAVLLGLYSRSHAQMQYNETNAYLKANAYWGWYNHIGIDWSSGIPVYDSNILSSLDTTEGFSQYVSSRECAARTVSDPYTGSLLFYVGSIGVVEGNRNRVVNWRHELMPNSDSLLGNVGTTVFQGQCIIPMPGDSNKYYVFSLGSGLLASQGKYQLYYHIVDITMNNGEGGIFAKNIILDSNLLRGGENPPLTDYGIVGIPGNSCDVWLVAHVEKLIDPVGPNSPSNKSAYYYAYHITASGISSSPVVSPSYPQHFPDDVHLTISPDRKWILAGQVWPYFGDDYAGPGSGPGSIVSSYPPSELAKFNPNTGEITSTQSFSPRLPNTTDTVWSDYLNVISAAFSPDNSKLYTISSNLMGYQSYLIQYDLTQSDSVSIMTSQTIIDSFGTYQIPPTTLFCIGNYVPALKLYNDTIFVSFGQMNKIGSINKPNESGIGCEFQLDYFSLPINKLISGGRDFSEVVYPMYSENTLVLDTLACNDLVLTPRVIDPYANYKWSTGETSSTITITSGEVHWVSYSFLSDNCVYTYTDSFKSSWNGIYPTPQITINVDTLSTAMAYDTYQWLYNGNVIPGETSRKLTITANGDYRVIVTNVEGCRDTSNVYTVDNRETDINAMSGLELMKLFPNPTQDKIYIQYPEKVYYQVLDATGRALSDIRLGNQVDLSTYASGMYQLIILDKEKRKLGSFKLSKL